MSQDEFLDDLLGRGAGDPDVHGYPGEDDRPTTAPLLPDEDDEPKRPVAEILEALGTTKVQIGYLKAAMDNYKAEETGLKNELMVALREAGLKSVKGEAYTASITEKPTVVIKDEVALMEWLRNEPDVEADFYIGVKKAEFGTLATQMLKESGELADGTDVETRESLAIRANPKKKEIKK